MYDYHATREGLIFQVAMMRQRQTSPSPPMTMHGTVKYTTTRCVCRRRLCLGEILAFSPPLNHSSLRNFEAAGLGLSRNM